MLGLKATEKRTVNVFPPSNLLVSESYQSSGFCYGISSIVPAPAKTRTVRLLGTR
jgi:hypothetical protein